MRLQNGSNAYISSFLKQSCQESIWDGRVIPVDGACFIKPHSKLAESSGRGESRMDIIQKKSRIKSTLTVWGRCDIL